MECCPFLLYAVHVFVEPFDALFPKSVPVVADKTGTTDGAHLLVSFLVPRNRSKTYALGRNLITLGTLRKPWLTSFCALALVQCV